MGNIQMTLLINTNEGLWAACEIRERQDKNCVGSFLKFTLHFLLQTTFNRQKSYYIIQFTTMRSFKQEHESDSLGDQSDEEYNQKALPGYRDNFCRTDQNLRKRGQAKNYALIEENYENQESGEENSNSSVAYYQGGKIQKVFGTRIRQGTQEEERLCKLVAKSYIHLEWLTQKEIQARSIQNTKFNKTQMEKMKENMEQVQLKYGRDCIFNPAYTRVDRILTAAVLFPVMHHKKASQMNGKWSESLIIVCSKLMNFEKYNIAYGILEKEDYDPEDVKRLKLQNPLKLEHVINRVYLDRYQKSDDFWNDIGECMRNMEKVYKGTHNEYDTLILKECVIFLYWQWFRFTQERYFSVAEKMKQKFELDPITEQQIKFVCEHEEVNWKKYVEYNIFLNQKQVQIPTNEKQLQRLNPKQFSYNWLSLDTNYSDFTFKLLSKTDFDKLDLNKEVDYLFLVKWCELDYDEATWEKESDLQKYSEKIKNFKLYSKVPPKKIRDKIDENKKYHKAILAQMNGQIKEKPDTVDKYRRRLYCLTSKEEFKQYGGQDIPIYKGYKMLKPFQLEGLNWLIKGWHEKRNCILADEMGLGKTIQTIAFLNHLTSFQGVIGPFLVIAPVSTLKQWRVEIEQWSDLNCVLYKGKNTCRELIEQFEFYHKFVTNQGFFVKFQKLIRFQVFLTNYELFLSDFELIEKFPFQYIIIDEAHRVKNQKTRLAVALRKLPCPRILLLTGTPIQNNTSQLWGLLSIIEPRRFNSFEDFKNKFGMIKTHDDLSELKETLKPYLLRRVKSDVEKAIPKLSQTLVTLELTKIQKAYYKGIIQKNKNQLINSLTSVNLNNIALLLRQCCNHPYMLSQEIAQEIQKNLIQDEDKVKQFIQCSSKMIFVHKFLAKCIQNKEKTLIFSQFRDMVQLLCDYCTYHGIGYQWLDGNIDYEERHTRIDRFNKHSDVSVFIISTKAGGVGINLTSATNIIIYDSDWNPQNDIQAIARAHRIGQRKTVSVYRLITNQTYEQIIYRTAVKKLGIGLAILDDQFFTNKEEQVGNKKKKGRSNEELEKLLRDGVAGFLKNENEEEANLENISIEEIIEKSGKAVDYETKQCAYTSAKFQYEEGKGLDIDDPNFWEVALKDVESPLQKLVKKVKVGSEQREEIFSDVSAQANLMVEANDIIYDFIKAKISMKHFNAQDERELRGFLQEITDSRLIHRGFKKIANDWLQELEKPSRRFEKIKVQDIMDICGSNPPSGVNAKEQIITRSTNNKRLKKPRSIMKISSSQDQEPQEQEPEKELEEQNSSNEKGEKKEEAQKPEETQKKETKKQKTVTVTKKFNSDEEDEQKQFMQLLEGVCGYCQKKRCSKICDGVCNRMFHAECYERHKRKEKVVQDQQLIEARMSKQELNIELSKEFYCEDCMASQGQCFICKKKSPAIIFTPRGKSYKRPKITDEDRREDKNYIDKVLSKMSQDQKKCVYQCRLTTCSKFYHIECLNQIKDKFIFEIDFTKLDNYYPIKCPRHFCRICSKPSSTIGISCLRCPIGLHTKCKSQTKQFMTVSDQYVICRQHLPNDASVAEKIDQLEQKKFLKKSELSEQDKEEVEEKHEERKSKKERKEEKKQLKKKERASEENIQEQQQKEAEVSSKGK